MKNHPKKSFGSIAVVACALSFGTSRAALILYSENFDGEGTASNAYNDGTTPEINLGGIQALQSTGASQGGNATDTAWQFFTTPSWTVGQFGLRFGPGVAGQHNWATGANSAAILAGGGFNISFDYDGTPASGIDKWFGVRVGNGGENSAVNQGDVDFGVLVRPDGRMSTFDNGAAGNFGSVGTEAVRAIELRYEFNSWAAGSTVNFTGLMDGSVVATDSFTWNGNDDVKIVFGGRNAGSLIDNIVISTVPEPSSAALLGILSLVALLRRHR